MLKIKIIVVGRTRSPFLKEGESFYLERLRRYVTVEWVEVKPERVTKGKMDKEIVEVESRAVSRKLKQRDCLVVLDRSGPQYSSRELADWLNKFTARAGGGATFAIGGPLGFSSELVEGAQQALSLSKLTLTHEMSRVLFLEQIYRACTIMKGEKYHK